MASRTRDANARPRAGRRASRAKGTIGGPWQCESTSGTNDTFAYRRTCLRLICACKTRRIRNWRCQYCREHGWLHNPHIAFEELTIVNTWWHLSRNVHDLICIVACLNQCSCINVAEILRFKHQLLQVRKIR